jgi:hypothetical protein
MVKGGKEGAPFGSKNALKLKDPEIRQRAFEAYLAWIADGKAKASFTFDDGQNQCSWSTIDRYLKKFSEEFDPEKLIYAKAKGYAKWEQICEDSAKGINQKANTATLQMIMRNKFDWDKKEMFRDENKEKILDSLVDAIQAKRKEINKK